MFWYLWYKLFYRPGPTHEPRSGAAPSPDAPVDRPQTTSAGSALTQVQLSVEDYQCSICFGILVEPVVGACGHDFCARCISNWTSLKKKTLTPLTCPVCRSPWQQHNQNGLGICHRYEALLQAAFPDILAARQKELRDAECRRQCAGQDTAAQGPSASGVPRGMPQPTQLPGLEENAWQNSPHMWQNVDRAAATTTSSSHRFGLALRSSPRPLAAATGAPQQAPPRAAQPPAAINHGPANPVAASQLAPDTNTSSSGGELERPLHTNAQDTPHVAFSPAHQPQHHDQQVPDFGDDVLFITEPQFLTNGSYHIPIWFPPAQILPTPVSRNIVGEMRRALDATAMLQRGDENASFTSVQEVLQDFRGKVASILGVQDDMRLLDHFFQSGIQMRLPHLWDIWTDWEQFQSFAAAVLQRWPQDRPLLAVRRELLAEIQRVLAEHEALLQSSSSNLQGLVDAATAHLGHPAGASDAGGDGGVASRQPSAAAVAGLLDRAKHNIMRILRLPSTSEDSQVVNELSWRLLMPCTGHIWASWDDFLTYGRAVVHRWASILASPGRSAAGPRPQQQQQLLGPQLSLQASSLAHGLATLTEPAHLHSQSPGSAAGSRVHSHGHGLFPASPAVNIPRSNRQAPQHSDEIVPAPLHPGPRAYGEELGPLAMHHQSGPRSHMDDVYAHAHAWHAGQRHSPVDGPHGAMMSRGRGPPPPYPRGDASGHGRGGMAGAGAWGPAGGGGGGAMLGASYPPAEHSNMRRYLGNRWPGQH